eukprot:TRINITY_DN984_c0_g1_i1.p1 TRINITY_DN984_c0_g1~~TRINITY_DN984_c0_g1_i1.p1  ORF type:complete len:212 (+),score=35.09 TRINITY_DN984_c0_g1_i1:1-636(+)
MKLKIFFLFIAIVFGQNPCCAPEDWRANYRSFSENGKSTESFYIYSTKDSATYLQSFYQSQSDTGQVVVEVWYYPKQNVSYIFNSDQDTCQKYSINFTMTDLNNCVGTDHDEYVTSVTIGTTKCSVWASPSQNGETTLFNTVANDGCIPVAFNWDHNFDLGYSFKNFDLWTNFTTAGVVIPPLNSLCSKAKLEKEPFPYLRAILESQKTNH